MASFSSIVSVSLNSAIDRTIQVSNLRVGAHLRGQRIALQPAGKGVNVARTLGVLGQPCTLTGFVGDEDAEWYRRSLHVDCAGRVGDRLVPVAGHTRQSITLIDPAAGVDTHIVEQGYAIGRDDLRRVRAALDELAAPHTLICFCGSLPPGVTVDHFVAMISDCLDKGASVAVDSSGEALRAACELPLALAKPNVSELAELVGAELSSEAAATEAARELAKRVTWVLLSLGADGALLTHNDHAWRGRLDVEPTRVVNTVGCGDALLAGFVDGWIRTKGDPAASLRRALSVAAANATSATVAGYDVATLGDTAEVADVQPC
ncbi:MAG: hexose kinase [Phycisphaera sp.]|nr:hexose kinase [Phycisphaera sp.]